MRATRESFDMSRELERALGALEGAQRRLERTEERVRVGRKATPMTSGDDAPSSTRSSPRRWAEPVVTAKPHHNAAATPHSRTGSIMRSGAFEDEDRSIPVYVPPDGEPCPQPAMRWAPGRTPGERGGGFRSAPRVPISLEERKGAAKDKKALLAGAAARECIAPSGSGWDGPFRVHRPPGPIKPGEKVVGLTVRNRPETAPLRRALERQYRQAAKAQEW